MDIRVDVEFFQHPKTVKLERRMGLEGVKALLSLWMWAAKHRPDGVLSGMDREDIEIAAGWRDDGRDFVGALTELGFLDQNQDQDGCVLHQWTEHNPWVAGAPERSDQGRLARMAHTYPELYAELVSEGVRGLSRAEYQRTVTEYVSRTTRTVKETLSPNPEPEPSPALIKADQKTRADHPQDNHTLSTGLSTNPQNEAQKLSEQAAKELFLRLYRTFPGYRPDTPERERAWSSLMSQYLEHLDISKEFSDAMAWVHKKHFQVRDSRAFLTKWLKRVQKERRLKRSP